MTRAQAFAKLARVSNELDAARFAIRRVLSTSDRDSSLADAMVAETIGSSQLRDAAENLQLTFVLRLFGEFEAILRSYWRGGLHRITRPDMRVLMDSIAARRSMSPEDLDEAHRVREYRNDIAHDNPRDAEFDFAACARAVGRYLRWLPHEW